jgi:acetyl esterase/lipase
MGLAQTSTCPVFAIDYRLAPEYRFPAAIEDALVAYCYMTNQAIDGILPRKTHEYRVILAGDSSGACLCLQLTAVLKRLKLKMPEGLVLISPFLDHSIF